MILDAKITSLLSKLVLDESGSLELEVRFGKIAHDEQMRFQTGVKRDWFDKVNKHLKESDWVFVESSTYKQYKSGARRVRVFDNGTVEKIRKSVISHVTIPIHKDLDIRFSLSREKTDDELPLKNLPFDWVYKNTYMWDVFKFDLTRTRKYHGEKYSWEYRVELEISNSIHSTFALVASLQENLESIIGEVALI